MKPAFLSLSLSLGVFMFEEVSPCVLFAALSKKCLIFQNKSQAETSNVLMILAVNSNSFTLTGKSVFQQQTPEDH